jgi:DNA-binding SARP family transcriptional activator/tetratricopeptide (TPR) repeat protein
MLFEILGPMRVTGQGGPRPVAGARQRIVLGALLARANQPVPPGELAETVWDGAPPPTAVATLRTYVMRLRQSLGPQLASRIVTRDLGYLVQVEQDELDALAFEALCRAAGAAVRTRAWADVLASATAALELWHGTPLADVPCQTLRDAWLPQLDQHRLQAVEWRIDAELGLGRADDLVPQLRELTVRHPLREHFHTQLMLALARTGRQSEALTAYRDARRVVVDELGVEPGPELRDLHRRVLAGDDGLLGPGPEEASSEPVTAVATIPRETSDPVRPAAVPRQLPAAPRRFTGRSAELSILTNALDDRSASGATPSVCVIGGVGGIGKTWLAVHWAHLRADRFPDGQLYVDLRGFDPSGQPTPAHTAIRGFLEALGVAPAAIPPEPEVQIGLYRSLMADKRMLILADNAREAAQVIPLLPAGPACMVLVTSRRRLTGLISAHGAVPVDLDALGRDDARRLLVRHLGHGRPAAEPDAVDALLACCAGLPLAISIVAARALTEPGLPLATLADELRDATARLDALATGDAAADVRGVLSWSYDALNPESAGVLGLLALAPGPDISAPAAASLTELPRQRLRRVLRELEHACLLQQHEPSRYRMHDLIRLHAAERAEQGHTRAERHAAQRRLVDFYTHSACNADHLINVHRRPLHLDPPAPGTRPCAPRDDPAAMAWLEAEYPNLVAAQQAAIAADRPSTVWQLAWALDTFNYRRGRNHDSLALWQAAARASARLDPVTAARTHQFLGQAYASLGRHQEAVESLSAALADADAGQCETADDARVHRLLAWVWEQRGDDRQALRHATCCLEFYRTYGEPFLEADALNAVGWYAARLGDYATARTRCHAALDQHRRHNSTQGEAITLDSLGYIEHHTGHHHQAIRRYQQAIDLYRALGNTYHRANTLEHLGHPNVALGQHQQARAAWQEALELFRAQHRDTDAARLLTQLAALRPDPASAEDRGD